MRKVITRIGNAIWSLLAGDDGKLSAPDIVVLLGICICSKAVYLYFINDTLDMEAFLTGSAAAVASQGAKAGLSRLTNKDKEYASER